MVCFALLSRPIDRMVEGPQQTGWLRGAADGCAPRNQPAGLPVAGATVRVNHALATVGSGVGVRGLVVAEGATGELCDLWSALWRAAAGRRWADVGDDDLGDRAAGAVYRSSCECGSGHPWVQFFVHGSA